MDFLKVEPGLSSETYSTSYDENQINDIKIEDDPVPVTYPAIKVEQEEVRYIYIYICLCVLLFLLISQVSRIISFLNSVCLPVHVKQFHSAE
jgi:hypothetical protein